MGCIRFKILILVGALHHSTVPHGLSPTSLVGYNTHVSEELKRQADVHTDNVLDSHHFTPTHLQCDGTRSR